MTPEQLADRVVYGSDWEITCVGCEKGPRDVNTLARVPAGELWTRVRDAIRDALAPGQSDDTVHGDKIAAQSLADVVEKCAQVADKSEAFWMSEHETMADPLARTLCRARAAVAGRIAAAIRRMMP